MFVKRINKKNYFFGARLGRIIGFDYRKEVWLLLYIVGEEGIFSIYVIYLGIFNIYLFNFDDKWIIVEVEV